MYFKLIKRSPILTTITELKQAKMLLKAYACIKSDEIMIYFKLGNLISLLEKILTEVLNFERIDYLKDGYKGEFLNGKCSGVGTVKFTNNYIFVGEFKNGFINGQGTLYIKDGSRFEGVFDKLKMINKGFYYDNNGNKHLLFDGVQNIILLGCGQCGKTTFYRRYLMYSQKDTSVEKDILKGQMVSNFLNILTFIGRLLIDYDYKNILNFGERKILIEFIQNSYFTSSNSLSYYTQDIYNLFLKIYKHPIYKKLINDRILSYSELETCFRLDPWIYEYPPILLRDKIISDLDYLRIYMKTVGINSNTVINQGFPIVIIDTGGQRSERKKWKSLSKQVNEASKIYYFVSLIEFAQILYEGKDYYGYDEETKNPDGNRMIESLNVFEQVINESPYQDIDIHLVFTKKDLFPKIFNLFFDYFYMVFPNECNYELVRYCHHERGLEIVKNAFLSRNQNKNRKIHIYEGNLMDSNDFYKIASIKGNELINGEKEIIENESIYFNENFWNPDILFHIQQVHFSHLLYLRFCLNRKMIDVNIHFQ